VPFTYHIEANGHIVHVIGTDQGSLESARDTFADLVADPHLHHPFGMLIDVRALCNIPSREEAYSLSKFAKVRQNIPNHYTALLVERGIQYGIARMIQVFSQLRGAQIDVFIDDQSAQFWLWSQLQLGAATNSTVARE
jgi:hypothetical protein